jgi:hypothetical protein
MAERGSTHHSGRVDDALAEEVEPLVRGGHESRASDDRLHEPPADEEPLPDARIAGASEPGDGVLDLDEIEARSLLAASLRPSAFPGERDDLYAVAEEQHASPDVLEALASLPAGIRFVNVQQVWELLGGDREQRSRRVSFATSTATATAPAAESEIAVVRDEPMVEPGVEAPAGEAWWLGPVRTAVGLATLPVRIALGVLRDVESRLRR